MAKGIKGPDTEASRAFNERLKATYLAAEEVRLRRDLKRQGFAIKDGWSFEDRKPYLQGLARLRTRDRTCEVSWVVRWRADAGRVTEISGGLGHICL